MTFLPSIELTEAEELGCVVSTAGVVVSTAGVVVSTAGVVVYTEGVVAFGPNGFALPTSPSSFGFLNSLYSAIEALHELQIY